MKNKKHLFALSLFPISITTPLCFAISCSNTQSFSNTEINSLKQYLDNFLSTSFNNKINNDLVTSSVTTINNTESLYRILLDDPNLINTYFSLNSKAINEALNQSNFDFENYKIMFSFYFDAKDSYGYNLKPTLSSNKNSITIPILINLTNIQNNASITKYVNFLSLSIDSAKVNDVEDYGYNDLNGKSISFTNSTQSIRFRSVPEEMIDKYLDFILLLENDNYKKQPVYQNESDKLKEWRGKTLSEVRQISQAITQPSNYYFNKQSYVYEIKNATFYDKNRHHANFIMAISIDSSTIPNKFLEDAKNIYNLSFTYEYTVIVSEWDFALPNESEISSYVSNNQSLLEPLVQIANDNIFIYVPQVAISYFEAKELGVTKIIERFNRNVQDFLPPEPFIYVTSNGQEREISFEIESLSEYEANSDVITINISMIIDKGDLKASSTFSKNFNINTWQFQ